MGDTSSSLIGDMIVDAGLASRAQVDECVAIQRSRQANSGTFVLLGQIMVDRGYVSPEQLVEVLQGDPVPQNNRFGDLCVRLGFLTPEQVQDAIAEQRRLRRRGKTRRLGDILLEKHQLNEPQLQAVLGAQGFAVAQCSSCHAECNVDLSAGPGAKTCERCGGEIVFVTAPEKPAVGEIVGAPPAGSTQPRPEDTQALREKLEKLEEALRQARADAEQQVNALREQLGVADGIRAVAAEERDGLLKRLKEAERNLADAPLAQERGAAKGGGPQEDVTALKEALQKRDAEIAAERESSQRRIVEAEKAREEAESIKRSIEARLKATDAARAGAAAARDELVTKLAEAEARLRETMPGAAGGAPIASDVSEPLAGGAASAPQSLWPRPTVFAGLPAGVIPPPPVRHPVDLHASPTRSLPWTSPTTTPTTIPMITRPTTTSIRRPRRRRRVLRATLVLLVIVLAVAVGSVACAYYAPEYVPAWLVKALESR